MGSEGGGLVCVCICIHSAGNNIVKSLNISNISNVSLLPNTEVCFGGSNPLPSRSAASRSHSFTTIKASVTSSNGIISNVFQSTHAVPLSVV